MHYSSQYWVKIPPLTNTPILSILVLMRGSRNPILPALGINNIKMSEDYLKLQIPVHPEGPGPEKILPSVILLFFQEDPTMCVASAPEVFVHRMEKTRNKTSIPCISLKKLHKKVDQSFSK